MGGGGGAQRPVWRGNEPKKTGARSARARTRGQNPLLSRKEQVNKKRINKYVFSNLRELQQYLSSLICLIISLVSITPGKPLTPVVTLLICEIH